MFSGSWRESEADSVSIDVADPNVTVAAFDTALGSLYQVQKITNLSLRQHTLLATKPTF